MSARRPLIGAALKWQPLRLEVDHLTGAVTLDEGFMGASAADLAALEWALRLAEAWEGEVVAACAGPAGADAMLRDALAEQLFTVENPAPKRGAVTIGRAELRRAGVRARDVARDAYAALRSFS